MSDIIIKVENLSKAYTISHVSSERYTALRDVLTSSVKKIPKLLRRHKNEQTKEEFFALKDVNFEINRGDIIGIIGRNGAGKSTLLKILSRITEPTTGRIHIKGRVASLLEVGTGFHPELTGRENIFLNGAILGMSRAEIRKKFDEIVDFADVEKFLDTPVKRYSSGMYVRLAFAVAAHLEPEVLIVDEVLAVGDAQFQKKCLGKMENVSRNEGRTVLFVSHNMGTISSLCNYTMLFERGNLKLYGNTAETILGYYSCDLIVPTYFHAKSKARPPSDRFVKLIEAGIYINGNLSKPEIEITENFVIEICFEILIEDVNRCYYPAFDIVNEIGIIVFESTALTFQKGLKGTYKVRCTIPGNLINEGTYFIGISIKSFSRSQETYHFYEGNILSFHIKDPIANVPTRLQINGIVTNVGKLPGTLRPLLNWEIEKVQTKELVN